MTDLEPVSAEPAAEAAPPAAPSAPAARLHRPLHTPRALVADRALAEGRPGAGFEAIVNGLKWPGDIGVDAKRRRVLVPEVLENRLRGFALER